MIETKPLGGIQRFAAWSVGRSRWNKMRKSKSGRWPPTKMFTALIHHPPPPLMTPQTSKPSSLLQLDEGSGWMYTLQFAQRKINMWRKKGHVILCQLIITRTRPNPSLPLHPLINLPRYGFFIPTLVILIKFPLT